MLTEYNGDAITYDTVGNPLTYRDGITMTWQNGRQLASFANSDTSVVYTYDVSGMRTSKTVTKDGTTDTVEYVYEGGLLLQMRYNHMCFDFSYDVNGAPVSMAYRSTAAGNPIYYYYALNSRGDVVGLYNSTGTLTAKYSYDAYGKLLSVTNASGGSIPSKYAPANLNPLRYRGYVYDKETGFYYLQSRYYDPETCRFVNGDGYASTGVGITGNNMFAYCNNNPVMSSDPTGESFIREAAGGPYVYCGPSSMAWGGGSGCGAGGAGGTVTVQYIRIIRPVAIVTTTATFTGGFLASTAVSDSAEQASSKDSSTTYPSIVSQQKNPKNQAYFPVNPNDFHPKGLELFVAVDIGEGKNGGIYKWRMPGSKVAIFEWNEDFKNGSHYHMLMVEWDSKHDGTHFKPGDPILEPWNTVFFGG